jgi:hypothetical protein
MLIASPGTVTTATAREWLRIQMDGQNTHVFYLQTSGVKKGIEEK